MLEAVTDDARPDEDRDDDADWLVAAPRTVKVRPLTIALLLVATIAVGLWVGAIYEKHHAGAGTARRSTSGAAASPSGSNRATRGGFAAGGAGTSGTVTAVDGTGFTMRTTSGTTLEVTVSGSTVVTRSADAAPGAVTAGDTVTVVGTTNGGHLAATSVTDTAKGVTASAGGGFGGPPGGTSGAQG